ncbi:MAG TPA: hypothetical protein VFJ02_03420 [Vicinamibacterales bacterium]|nr:hypothetical protein [Vicinamibacterales bacterium]
MNPRWSLDARVLAAPRHAFLAAAERAPHASRWTATRRPLFVALVLGCVMSLLAASVVTARLAFPTALYWAFVPLVEALAFIPLAHRWRARVPTSLLVDTFFAGHAPWTLFLIVMALATSMLGPSQWWFFITRVWLYAAGVVIAWSAYIDYCFWRQYLGATRGQAIRRLVIHRAIVWFVIFWIFAVPARTPRDFAAEVAEAIQDVAR